MRLKKIVGLAFVLSLAIELASCGQADKITTGTDTNTSIVASTVVSDNETLTSTEQKISKEVTSEEKETAKEEDSFETTTSVSTVEKEVKEDTKDESVTSKTEEVKEGTVASASTSDKKEETKKETSSAKKETTSSTPTKKEETKPTTPASTPSSVASTPTKTECSHTNTKEVRSATGGQGMGGGCSTAMTVMYNKVCSDCGEDLGEIRRENVPESHVESDMLNEIQYASCTLGHIWETWHVCGCGAKNTARERHETGPLGHTMIKTNSFGQQEGYDWVAYETWVCWGTNCNEGYTTEVDRSVDFYKPQDPDPVPENEPVPESLPDSEPTE